MSIDRRKVAKKHSTAKKFVLEFEFEFVARCNGIPCGCSQDLAVMRIPWKVVVTFKFHFFFFYLLVLGYMPDFNIIHLSIRLWEQTSRAALSQAHLEVLSRQHILGHDLDSSPIRHIGGILLRHPNHINWLLSIGLYSEPCKKDWAPHHKCT